MQGTLPHLVEAIEAGAPALFQEPGKTCRGWVEDHGPHASTVPFPTGHRRAEPPRARRMTVLAVADVLAKSGKPQGWRYRQLVDVARSIVWDSPRGSRRD